MSFGKIAFASVFGLGSALAFASGCGPDAGASYYCDSLGCYSCDGYGCSSVPTPSKPSCRSTAACGVDAVCTELGCAQKCTSDAACPQGEVCKGSICIAPTTTTPPKTLECTDKADCATGSTCIAGACKACGGTNGPCPCTAANAATQCGTNEACVAGSCTPKTSTCTFSSECPGDKVCADGQCLAGCDATKTCGNGFSCDRGVCKPDAVGPDCSSGAACPSGSICVAGSCAPQCTQDTQCGNGKYCNQGACAVDTRPQPNCTSDAQCGGGANPRVCMGGFCKYRCDTDQTCRTIDSRIGYCGQDKVCRTAQEANPECRDSIQCGQGKLCIDNACR